MQTAFHPPPQTGYQPLSEAEIYTIKRQYLGLLPPQQIIDICLTFEAHAPLHVKSSVWPYDIRAAISSILAQKELPSHTQTSPESATPSKTSAPDLCSSLGENTSHSNSSQPASPVPAQPSVNTPSASQPVASQIPSATPGPHYPHQPYYHPTYPPASYYTPPPTTYSYPYPYPSHSQPPALHPAGLHPPLFTNTPLVHPPNPTVEQPPPLNNVEDLPSYEEMIVEALLDSGDPEGCAPKSLFGWMALHYPLQMNFRPSASQALQKAYKRGRLEKGNNGKYRLNENWEGGNTSRRTTRRPQALAQTTLPGTQPPSSPFTHAPLVPHGAINSQTRPLLGQPPGCGGYPFGYPYQITPDPAHILTTRDSRGAASRKQAADVVDHETGEGSDAWEAAQNILKAINFGQLFQISNEENKAGEPSTSANPADQRASADGSDKPLLPLRVPEGLALTRLDGSAKSAELNAEQRAALQAQLALLAAQLAELADVSEDELSHNLDVPQRTATMPDVPQISNEGSNVADDEDNEDMIEVLVPTSPLTT